MRTIALVAGLVLATLVGCAGVPLSMLESRGHATKNGAGSAYVLKQDITINGQRVPKGHTVEGLPKNRSAGDTGTLDDVEWLIRPEFEHLRGNGGIVYGKRYGATHWVRFDMSGERPKEEASPYTDVTRIPFSFSAGAGWHERDRWVGMEAGRRLAVFGPDGKPVITFDDVAGHKPENALKLMRQDGALLVHHSSYDRLYAGDGTPISPELPPLWSATVLQSKHLGMAPTAETEVFGVQTVPKRRLYWLVQENGRTLPKPDDLLGLEPLTAKLYSWEVWSGWLVWWKTPAGERCARVELEDASGNLAALMASRERAEFVEWTTRWNPQRHLFEDIVRRADQTSYDVYRHHTQMNDRPLESVAVADQLIADTRKAEAEEARRAGEASFRAAAIRREDALRDKARQAVERRAAEQARKAKLIADAESAFDAAMNRNNRVAAREQLLKLNSDRERWTRYVAKFGIDPAGDYDSMSVSYARAQAGGTDATVLAAALKKSKPAVATPAYQGPQSDWDYFWNGPRGGQIVSRGGSGYDPKKSIDQTIKHLETTRQQNRDAWLRGAQNWK